MMLIRYKENLEEQEAHFQTQQKTFVEHFEREKSMLIAEQKKRDRETSIMLQQTELHFQVSFKIILLLLMRDNHLTFFVERNGKIKRATRNC